MIYNKEYDPRIKKYSNYNYIPNEDLTPEERQEYIKCKLDREYFLSHYFYIQHPWKGIAPLEMYDKQRLANKILDKFHFLIVLKSRQTGMTTDISGVIAHSMIFYDNWGAGIISKRGKEAKKMVAKIKYGFNELSRHHPFLMHKVVKQNESEIILENNSSVISDTATEDGIRGDTICFLVVDEVAHNIKMKEAYHASYHSLSLMFANYLKAEREGQPINRPWGVAMFSSPKGKKGKGEFFYKMWRNARHPGTKVREPNKFIPLRFHWSEIEVYDEQWYREECAALDYDILTIKQELDLLFLDSTSEILPQDIVQNIITQPKPKYQFYNKKLNIYRKPKPGGEYILGVDVATGETSGDHPDRSAIVVIEAHSGTVQADYNDVLIYNDFSEVVFNVGKLYNYGLAAVERNSIGIAVVELLRDSFRYPNMYQHRHSKNKNVWGFPTTRKNRNRIVSKSIAFLYENPVLNSLNLLSEFTELENRNGKIAGYGNNKDDLVMAFAISLEVRYRIYGYEIGTASLKNPLTDDDEEAFLDKNTDIFLKSNDVDVSDEEYDAINHFHKEITRIEEETGMVFSKDEMDNVMKKMGNYFNRKNKMIKR